MATKKKLFRLASTQGSTRKPKFFSIRAEEIKDEKDTPPFYVRGQKADSKNEYWVSIVLDEIEEQTGWTWEYQVPVYGGRHIKGGNIIDFLIHRPGRWVMLDPMSPYHHTGKYEDRQQMENVARRKGYELIAWFTTETPSLERTRSFLRNKLNV